MHRKIVAIGLDGATWDVLMPLIERGALPTMKTMVESGCYGVLESTIPPVSGCAWLAMATGRNPGKTGVIDFVNRKDFSGRLYPVSSDDFKGISVWDYLSIFGVRVGVFNYPMLYPPYEVNGFMVSGIGAPSYGSITYPKALLDELRKVSDGYEIYLNYHDEKYENLDLFLYDLDVFIRKFEKAVYYVIENKEWDFLFLVFSVTDWVQHVFWRHIDKKHPEYQPDISPKYELEFVRFWKKIDEILSNILRRIPSNTIVIVVSDHGFGTNDQIFNLAKWLMLKGYLIKRRSLSRKFKKLLYNIARDITPNFLKKVIMSKTGIRPRELVRSSITDEIDMRNSLAYCLGHTIPFGAIYLNREYENYDELLNRIIRDLSNLGRELRRSIDVKVYEARKVYSGDKLIYLPDLIFTINDWRCVIIENSLDGPLFEDRPFSSRHTGSHRLNGIFLAYGPEIGKGQKIEGLKIYDIMPTILHIFGLPIPDDIDGKVLQNIFDKDSELYNKEPKYVPTNYYANHKLKIAYRIHRLKVAGKFRKL